MDKRGEKLLRNFLGDDVNFILCLEMFFLKIFGIAKNKTYSFLLLSSVSVLIKEV